MCQLHVLTCDSGNAFGGSTFGGSTLGGSTLLGNQSTTTTSHQAAIDLNHLRPTTKFDQLTKDLQTEIENLDNAIQNEITNANAMPHLLAKVSETGDVVPGAIELVSGKLEEIETGLENDADSVMMLRDGAAKKGEGEAKCVFRSIDRLKVPRQYQVGHKQNESISGGVYGASGLSGWWNNPHILKASTRGSSIQNGQAQTMQLPGEEVEDSGPKSLVELFNKRAEDMSEMTKSHRELLGEIEDFVAGLEDKVRGKERQLNERLNYGGQVGSSLSEKEHQLQLLKYVFGEVDRSMYEVAGKVGACRDDILGLGVKR